MKRSTLHLSRLLGAGVCILISALSAGAGHAQNPGNFAPVIVPMPGVLPASDKTPKKPEAIDEFKTGSIMYDETDITRVNKIITAFMSGVRQENTPEEVQENKDDVFSEILSQLDNKGDIAPKAHILPSFYLSSIVYYSPGEWAVWVNGFKITNSNNKKEPPLYVESLSKHQVTFVWYPARLILSDVRSITAKNKQREKAVPLDTPQNSVTFTLKPNQTFVSGIMAVKEGKILSVTLDKTPENAANIDATATGNAGNTGAAPPGMPGSMPNPGGQAPQTEQQAVAPLVPEGGQAIIQGFKDAIGKPVPVMSVPR